MDDNLIKLLYLVAISIILLVSMYIRNQFYVYSKIQNNIKESLLHSYCMAILSKEYKIDVENNYEDIRELLVLSYLECVSKNESKYRTVNYMINSVILKYK